jgi:hypothetical protein
MGKPPCLDSASADRTVVVDSAGELLASPEQGSAVLPDQIHSNSVAKGLARFGQSPCDSDTLSEDEEV